jgi:hypothetical protein
MQSQRLLSRVFVAILSVLAGFGALAVHAENMRVLQGHLPAAGALAHPLGPLAGTNLLRLAISLPLHNAGTLTNLLQRLYDPASPDYHHYLTPAEFSARFGPTEQDYQTLIQFAESNGLKVVSLRDSKMLLDVQGTASDVEKAFHVTLRAYQHPTEDRQFFAPDAEPTVDASLPILNVTGLSDYAIPRPMLHREAGRGKSVSAAGSQAAGYYLGSDFRNAYVPGVPLTGSGQMVGLLELDGYYTNDIIAYEKLASLPDVPLLNTPSIGFPRPSGSDVIEVSLDIEMAISMAPGLAAVVVFGSSDSSGTTGWIDILDSMASSNQVKQFSSSWGYTGSPDPETSFDTEFQKMAAQGQSFFQASGDGDAWTNPIWIPADSPYVTSVGGTILSMTGAGTSYSSETVWNEGDLGIKDAWSPNGDGYIGSGGGVSTVYTNQSWQQAAINSTNKGSTTMRNIPDVAMAADDIWVIYDNGHSEAVAGTSCAAPLWAGFAALVNQQAAAGGSPSVGFLNPALYALGGSAGYASSFHDITTGNNTNAQSANLYFAVPGYDLCTGWGTPNGAGLINALSPEPQITSPLVSWASPPAITYGTPLGPAQLDATASVPGSFIYQPPAGTVLDAGDNLLAVVFIPSDSVDYSSVTNTVTVAVTMATPGINWPPPAAIIYGTALGSAELDATANVAGSFDYEPPAGVILDAGTNTLLVIFSPDDSLDYTSVTNSVSLPVTMAAPSLSWAAPDSIIYGTALGSNQLDATANVPGAFEYNPPAGTVLSPGTNMLSVLFTPMDAVDYTNACESVSLVVSVAPIALNIQLCSNAVVLSWNDPASVFSLQAAPAATCVFTNVPGAASPYTNAITGAQQYFRLLAN